MLLSPYYLLTLQTLFDSKYWFNWALFSMPGKMRNGIVFCYLIMSISTFIHDFCIQIHQWYLSMFFASFMYSTLTVSNHYFVSIGNILLKRVMEHIVELIRGEYLRESYIKPEYPGMRLMCASTHPIYLSAR